MMKRVDEAILILIVATGVLPVHAGPAPRPVFLKLNQYYILYTHPTPPFMDKSGRLMVPADVVPKLMGLEVTVDPGSRAAAHIARGGRSILIFVSQPWANVDDPTEPRRVDVVPRARLVGTPGEMFIPLRILTDTFGFSAAWNPTTRILSLSDRRIMSPTAPERTFGFFEEELIKTRTADTDKLIPAAFALERVKEHGVFRLQTTLLLRNISGRDIPYGQQALYTFVQRMSGRLEIGGRDIFISADMGRTKDPCVKTRKGFRCGERFSITRDPIRYVAVRVRMRK